MMAASLNKFHGKMRDRFCPTQENVKMLPRKGFISKPIERPYVPLNGKRDF